MNTKLVDFTEQELVQLLGDRNIVHKPTTWTKRMKTAAHNLAHSILQEHPLLRRE